jgi:hypothetical protein
MKKICFTVCVMVLAATLASAGDGDIEMNFSGEVKTGVLWDKVEEPGSATIDRARMGNNDDAGIPGRIRLDGELIKGNIGFKMRWETNNYINAIAPNWSYAYGYGDFINNQLRLSGGRLGQSPWSSGGYEIWDELDNRAGLRVEVKPNILRGLNVGFVLNQNNTETTNTEFSLVDMLAETIVGISYTHDYFAMRAAYRFDSDADSPLDNKGKSEGMDFIYRVEEKALRNVVEGLSIFANGRLLGIMAESEARINYVNWLYIQYNPGALDAQIRTGVDVGYKKYFFKLKPVISYGITDFLRIGFTFIYEKDFGEAAPAKDAPYKTLAFEPMIRVDFKDMYVALAYQFNRNYTAADRIRQTNWVNLRFVYMF